MLSLRTLKPMWPMAVRGKVMQSWPVQSSAGLSSAQRGYCEKAYSECGSEGERSSSGANDLPSTVGSTGPSPKMSA